MKTHAEPELSRTMAGKSDEELVGMFGRAREWREEALEAAGMELERRGVAAPERRQGKVDREAEMPAFKLVCLGMARMVAGLLVAMVGGIFVGGAFGSSGPVQPEWMGWAGAASFAVVAMGVVGFLGWGIATVARGVARGMWGAGGR